MTRTEDALRDSLGDVLTGLPERQAQRAVERLIEAYRGDTPTTAPVLRDHADVAAYAAYRMPATFQAVRAALGGLREAAPAWSPASHADIGGGTGAAVWAAEDAWPGGDRSTTVLDWAEPALAIGKELASAAAADAPALAAADWCHQVIGEDLQLRAADLVTVSYVLGELTAPARQAVLTAAAGSAQGAVVVVEPGTPEGYLRIMEARDILIEAGYTVAAPCPHSGACPIETGADWCHFAARVQRSSLHRRVKGGELGYEDEKFSYVAAVRPAAVPDCVPAANRVVRHPLVRKGLVMLDLCTAEQTLERRNVSKRLGPVYRQARDASWGASWNPPGEPGAPEDAL
ncbi:small ribosomal subunit Rsm22 family protein [Streptomyces boninensis]|uniref:small ribosomal subunit Rsm22 family protein n=1 Tax=Streptomyces boninensis TaxID=2039455 RepID=UPI003B2116D0